MTIHHHHHFHQRRIHVILRVFPEKPNFWNLIETEFLFLGAKCSKGSCNTEVLEVFHAAPCYFDFQAGRRVKKVRRQDSHAPAYSHSAIPIAPAFRKGWKATAATSNCRLQNQPLRLAELLRQGSLGTLGLFLQRFWVPCVDSSSIRECTTARKTILPNSELTELFSPNIKHLKKAVSAEFIKLTLQLISAQLLYPTVGGRKH